ncbi:phage baseplate assembly protein V, partial [Capnocytophaga sp. oral taxon 326]|uniref:phage baseplate assembly protein V n=1 Tax=Capnocytophaga sp. oral taxon 326 TaxID=712212 RepID=UPI0002A375CD
RMNTFACLTDINARAMETYRVIKISHYHSGMEYYNSFEGIPMMRTPADFDENAFPHSEQQPAIVKDNNDPLGMGRIRVQFLWQAKRNEMTPWIRVVQPYTGGGKGFYFVPEIGEEVLVDFEGGNAERPFVLGAHYNGEAKSGYHNADNRVKAIHTKSGHKLIFTEDESILLSDKNGNTLRFDTQGKNIEISAPETISIRCKNFELNASQNIKTEAGQDHIETISKDKRTTISQNFSVEVTGDMIEHISGSIDSHTDQERKISSNDMGIESKHNMRAKASGKTQRFSGEQTMDN